MESLNRREDTLRTLAKNIWTWAEPAYREYRSADAQRTLLRSEGFRITDQLAGIPSAFAAEYGAGAPVIALLGEFDALPALSQKVSTAREPLIPGACGHGCGHNLIAPGAIGAALAVKDAIDAGTVSGTVRYYACPAEESGSGKGFMVRSGAFDGVDAALTWHPEPISQVVCFGFQAVICVDVRFHGIAAHAAAAPEAGRSALDAVELMNVGCNYLREHIAKDECLHYIITDGGRAANIVPAEAAVQYMVRAPQQDRLLALLERVKRCAQGAALMTDTTFDWTIHSAANALYNNCVLEDLLYEALQQVGTPAFTPEDESFAAALAATFPETSAAARAKRGLSEDAPHLFRGILTPEEAGRGSCVSGSTDLGDVSCVLPLAHFNMACAPLGTPAHSWQNTAACGSETGLKGMFKAAEVLAVSALTLYQEPERLAAAKREFQTRTGGAPYQPLLPDEVQPPAAPESLP